MYVSLFSYVWIPESQPIWGRAAASVFHLMPLHIAIFYFNQQDFFKIYISNSLAAKCCHIDDL